MNSRKQAGFTLTEFIVCALIVIILLAVTLPNVTVHIPRGSMTQSLSNLKQLHLATQQMALDGNTTGNTNLGWPGDIGGTFTNWAETLVREKYLTTNDLRKLLSAPQKVEPSGGFPTKKDSAFVIYAVREISKDDAVFGSTANFTNTPNGGLPPEKDAKPYGNVGFVVFRKAGDGAILQARQAGQTNIVGTFVPPLQ